MINMIGYTLLGLFGLAVMGGTAFVNLSPEFGGKHTETDILKYEESENYREGIFHNRIPINMSMGARNMDSLSYEFFFNENERAPKEVPPIEKLSAESFFGDNEKLSFVWFGHSTLLIKMDEKTILIDPMFSDVPSPHPMLGNSRYQKELPMDVNKLPKVDYVFISHDHYDHLDYQSIQLLKKKVNQFYVPLGIGRHLKDWGIAEENIIEFDWWDEYVVDDFEFVFTPARHFSGRGITNRFSTLWGSWVIRSPNNSIYFSGDSGFGDHFKEIGDKYGPFDLAFLECGQYNEMWADVHMMPHETAQAAIDLKAKSMMPIHWGSFTLSLHSWTDPIERIMEETNKFNMPLVAPNIGEIVSVGNGTPSLHRWWETMPLQMNFEI